MWALSARMVCSHDVLPTLGAEQLSEATDEVVGESVNDLAPISLLRAFIGTSPLLLHVLNVAVDLARVLLARPRMSVRRG
jgi:hypothetical protein